MELMRSPALGPTPSSLAFSAAASPSSAATSTCSSLLSSPLASLDDHHLC